MRLNFISLWVRIEVEYIHPFLFPFYFELRNWKYLIYEVPRKSVVDMFLQRITNERNVVYIYVLHGLVWSRCSFSSSSSGCSAFGLGFSPYFIFSGSIQNIWDRIPIFIISEDNSFSDSLLDSLNGVFNLLWHGIFSSLMAKTITID